ncbi:MAG TPA: beta-ketoacyl synthase chain length factor [Bacteroidia bacterium]|nr:beta-ketoacyl synthase chain length factor [Bacteroidia bacterium]
MKKKVYIRSSGIISPQATYGENATLEIPRVHEGDRMHCIEPDYRNILDPKLIRRMSRIIRMGAAAALECMTKSGLKEPDAIITGTAYGCLEDTITFLNRMVENKEEMLTPTAFIQSTHNTVGSQIALLLKCHRYNNTFVHRGLSFEQAIQDALLLLQEEDTKNVLVGGIDELTDTSHAILRRFGLYRRDAKNTDLIPNPGKGTMAGEGAGFFLLSAEKSPQDLASLDEIRMLFNADGESDVLGWIHSVLKEHRISLNDIDLILLGKNGDEKNDRTYSALESAIEGNTKTVYFKHLCGEFPTATAFGLWMAASTISNSSIPFSGNKVFGMNSPEKVLVYNFGQNGHHSLMLLSAC